MTDRKYIKASPEERESFGARLAEARKLAGFGSQTDLGEVLGIRPQTIQQWEAGRTMPRRERLQVLSNVLGVSESWLLTGEGLRRPGGEGYEAGSRVQPVGQEVEAQLRERLAESGLDVSEHFGRRLELGGIPLSLDYVSSRLVLELKIIRGSKGWEDKVASGLWQLDYVRAMDEWMGFGRRYVLALVPLGSRKNGPAGSFRTLKKQAELKGLELVEVDHLETLVDLIREAEEAT